MGHYIFRTTRILNNILCKQGHIKESSCQMSERNGSPLNKVGQPQTFIRAKWKNRLKKEAAMKWVQFTSVNKIYI